MLSIKLKNMEAKTFALMPVKEKSCFGFTSIKTKKTFWKAHIWCKERKITNTDRYLNKY